MADSLSIIFAGTPDFAVPPLRRVLDSGHLVRAVLTQPDRPAGRGRKLTASPVKREAVAAGIEVLQPASLKDQQIQSVLGGLQADLMIVVAYGLILPPAVLSIPRLGCWNIHASLLPRWRGAAPIQRAILAGDEQTGVCIMQMDAGLDTGPLIQCASQAIATHCPASDLHDQLADLGADTLLKCLSNSGNYTTIPQAESGACYADKLSKSEAELDWHQDAMVLERKVRGFNAWPVARCDLAGESLRIWMARAETATAGAEPGTVTRADKQGICVATGNGDLRLLEVQRAGGRRIRAVDYLNARPELAPGQ
jgi:methionyl-tRNA formyltransferase